MPYAVADLCSRDLLIRHNRLSHAREAGENNIPRENDSPRDNRQPGSPQSETRSSSPPPPPPLNPLHLEPHHQLRASSSAVQGLAAQSDRPSVDAVSGISRRDAFRDAFAAEDVPYTSAARDAAMEPMSYQDPLDMHIPASPVSAVDPCLLPGTEADNAETDYDVFNSFADFLETGPFPSFHFSSLFTTEQPLPLFSPQDFNNIPDEPHVQLQANRNGTSREILQDPESFSRFGSRLPSLQPEEQPEEYRQPAASSHLQQVDVHRNRPCTKRISDVSNEDRQVLMLAISCFDTVPSDFRLPSRMTLARYIRAYVDGFHEHLPFLHIPSMTVAGCSVELTLSMAAVGAQYCFEAEQGLGLFHAARAIATERIRRRDARIAAAERGQEQAAASPSEYTASTPSARGRSDSVSNRTFNGPLGLPSDHDTTTLAPASPTEDLMQSAQALLILMAMATWAKHKEILREALAIQSILASIVRDHGLRQSPRHEPPRTWHEWARFESFLRTKYIVFCFFNLHCIVYDIPPLILNSELNMVLPCATSLFKAPTESQWAEESRRVSHQPMNFQDALRLLFSSSGSDSRPGHSALGNYILIHAIIQHIFFVRQSARCRFDAPDLMAGEVTPLDQAVRNWQSGWKQSPESSINPMDPNGPVAFNSTALLRLAYIRLNMDTGPGRSLGTRDPLQIAHALKDSPTVKRTPRLTRALLHSAHALSIPIKIGIRLVAKTQTFIWSIQHSLCSLECALLLGKWLEAVSSLGVNPNPPLSDGEMRVLSLVRTMLDETEWGVPVQRQNSLQQLAKNLNAGVLRVWAAIFKGSQTWAIVECIGNSLDIYADMLDAA